MIGVVLAALAGLAYGASDFSGAVASKRTDAMVVTVIMQAVSLAALLAILAVWPEDTRTVGDLAWGALAGVGAAIGLTTFYMALARGPVATAASMTGLVGAIVPVGAGLALGDRPGAIAFAGIALSIPATVLVSAGGDLSGVRAAVTPRGRIARRAGGTPTRALSVVAGLGFGLFFVALSRTSADAGLFPLLGARAASIGALALGLTVRRSWGAPAGGSWPLIVVAGALDCAANGFYITALGRGTFTWIAALTSLYPVATVLLARAFLKERLGPIQVLGLVLAASALALIAVGR